MPAPSRKETFDLQTHETDRLTQKTTAVNLYRLHVINAVRYFERPVNSGNLWFENNKPAGRLTGPNQIDRAAAHIEFTPPPTGAERIARELVEAKKIALDAMVELEAIKKERDALTAKKPAQPKKDE